MGSNQEMRIVVPDEEVFVTDVLVIGGGLADCFAVIKAQGWGNTFNSDNPATLKNNQE